MALMFAEGKGGARTSNAFSAWPCASSYAVCKRHDVTAPCIRERGRCITYGIQHGSGSFREREEHQHQWRLGHYILHGMEGNTEAWKTYWGYGYREGSLSSVTPGVGGGLGAGCWPASLRCWADVFFFRQPQAALARLRLKLRPFMRLKNQMSVPYVPDFTASCAPGPGVSPSPTGLRFRWNHSTTADTVWLYCTRLSSRYENPRAYTRASPKTLPQRREGKGKGEGMGDGIRPESVSELDSLLQPPLTSQLVVPPRPLCKPARIFPFTRSHQ